MTDTEHYDFTTRELADRLGGPYPEQWTDVIGALAERAMAAARDITATVIDADEGIRADYDSIRDAIEWLPYVTDKLETARGHIESTANAVRDLL